MLHARATFGSAFRHWFCDFAVRAQRSALSACHCAALTGDSRRRGRVVYIADLMARRSQTPPKSFEDALQELEQILSDIEGGQVGLEESLVKYERGTFLIQHCRGVLNTAEKQIEVLSKSADGGIEAASMEEGESAG